MRTLEVEDLDKIYGEQGEEQATKALHQVSLTVNKGEFVAIMGPSGSGKTTLLHVMSGIDDATSGTVFINGKELSAMGNDELALFRRRELGFVFQEFQLIDSLTVKENIMLPMILEKKHAFEIEERTDHIAKLFGIEMILDKYPYHISGGQKQRTAISRALMNEPDIIFADEPTGNLDSKSSAVIMDCFEKVVKQLGTTVLLVTHDVFAASYCQRVVFIKDGEIDSEITSHGERKEFLAAIIDNLARLGGGHHVF
ncbi:ABC transporter ATP-binding protein [Alkalihalobacillus pseudalcaliphilus]|uniref:ABC transporter ATP-binding protein n=1 Tax=Alkalihalobacillus pseudalcaliphilus TaxID=79884 RepID=UPI00064DD3A6|nr:ABC transporter ATP-binding protein [Alkalihalobacillus pseudalcaliphilus]KMK77697.1 multidrug ABC transporter ATP-binding protein [Alkalihalobacillus pseudalcaliphilus]